MGILKHTQHLIYIFNLISPSINKLNERLNSLGICKRGSICLQDLTGVYTAEHFFDFF